MLEFFRKWQGLIVPLVAIVNTLISAYMTLAVEHRPVNVPGLVLVLPEEGVVASIPERAPGGAGAGFLAVGLMSATGVGLAFHYGRKKKEEVKEIPVEAKGIPGVIAKFALSLAIRYLEVRAPKSPGDLDDNILKLLILLRDSNVLDLLKIQEAAEKIKAESPNTPENVEVVK